MKYNDFKVSLCNDKSTDTWVNIDAKLEKGCLTFVGQDIGEMPKKFFGKDEYEYWYTFDSVNTAKLLKKICGFMVSPKKALIKYFSGMEGCERLRALCKENNIEYNFFSY